MLTGQFEAFLHWSTHVPVFRSALLNRLHRSSFAIMPLPAAWYRYEHFHYHALNNTGEDMSTTLTEKMMLARDSRIILPIQL